MTNSSSSSGQENSEKRVKNGRLDINKNEEIKSKSDEVDVKKNEPTLTSAETMNSFTVKYP
ncbi:6926_t:CDS:2, partial [Gigaspora margarita]